jgi:HEAT repeat protein
MTSAPFSALRTLLILATAGAALSAAAPAQSVDADIDTAHTIIEVGLDSKDPTLRVEAVSATGMIAKSDSVRKRIEGFLSDKDVNVRVAATQTLADLGSNVTSTQALESVLNNDPVPEVQFAAAKALYKLKDPKGQEALENILYEHINTKSSLLQREKRRVSTSFHSAHGATVFLLETGGGLVPVPGAGEGLGEIGRLMSDTALSPRATIVLLGRAHSVDADNLLRFSLKDKDWTVRASAALMIALTARKDMRQYIVPLLSDGDQKVRFRAAGAYLHLVGGSAPQDLGEPSPTAPKDK